MSTTCEITQKPRDRRKRRILVVSSLDISLLTFRGRLIEALIGRNFDVLVAAPSYRLDVEAELKRIGALVFTYPVSRGGLSLREDWNTYKSLADLMYRESVDLVFPYNIKPVLYASLAARKYEIPAVGLVTGLGYVFSGKSLRQRVLRNVVLIVYRFSVAKNRAMIFQNVDDAKVFKNQKLIGENTNVQVVAGSGVDLNEYKWREPRKAASLRFVFVARLIVEKGFELFLAAAAELKIQWPDAEFHIYGEPEIDSPHSVELGQLTKLVDDGIVFYHGRCFDIAEKLGAMDVLVLPTWYREGIPRSILEALSVGLAVIVTDTPGCRETVIPSVNGWLVPPQCQEKLTAAMRDALENPSKIEKMSKESRKLAEARFDVHSVNRDIIEVLAIALSSDERS